MPRRGKGWRPASTELMLDKIELFLPAGRNVWTKVADAYNTDGKAFPKRDIDSLRRKFATLKNRAKPTGHPSAPPTYAGRSDSVAISTKTLVCARWRTRTLMKTSMTPWMDLSTSLSTTSRIETGLPRNELIELGKDLKRQRATESSGMLSNIARKRQSLDKFIAGAAEADAKASSDFMSMMMIMEARSTEREEQRHMREMEWRAEERVRQDRRDELHMMLMAKLFDSKHK
ncbi:hypothetical protein H257_04888 [Aphanomyces astaci]|uniref:DUF6818 domain-containing protein n=1 Tax=Aphanomyces astaci TaxID=112090 RepID=W4GS68_APHAT|nr:hypothetical protein H257_04888 [Aphanomyces astaci]ETV82176.1 hypothetical protein H257_04888 [Aphanomyces astaci]|eukprot:XP_009827845.1 hypothetical protein H257_04888 [Aphanomyces astaci]